jgi:site-specific recombinase XerD
VVLVRTSFKQQLKGGMPMPKNDLAMYEKKFGLISLFDHHIKELKQRVESGEITKSTLTKNKTVRNKVEAYIKQAFKRDDLPVTVIPRNFLENFHNNLVFEQGITHNTAVTYIVMLEKVFRLAIKNQWIVDKQKPTYPYRKRKVSSTDYLTIEELDRLEELRSKPGINKEALLLFLFSCYTGVTLTEMMHLNTEDVIEEESEDDLWLAAEGVEHWEIRYVPVSIEAENIIGMFEKKRLLQGSELLFPVELNDNIESDFEVIAKAAGIQKPITFLTGVNTFYFSFSNYMHYPESSYEWLIPHHESTGFLWFNK